MGVLGGWWVEGDSDVDNKAKENKNVIHHSISPSTMYILYIKHNTRSEKSFLLHWVRWGWVRRRGGGVTRYGKWVSELNYEPWHGCMVQRGKW